TFFFFPIVTVRLFTPCVTRCCCLCHTALLYLGLVAVVNENLFSTSLPGEIKIIKHMHSTHTARHTLHTLLHYTLLHTQTVPQSHPSIHRLKETLSIFTLLGTSALQCFLTGVCHQCVFTMCVFYECVLTNSLSSSSCIYQGEHLGLGTRTNIYAGVLKVKSEEDAGYYPSQELKVVLKVLGSGHRDISLVRHTYTIYIMGLL
ncbi:unnamed protein product, partial [Oncorhynchus mykiss]